MREDRRSSKAAAYAQRQAAKEAKMQEKLNNAMILRDVHQRILDLMNLVMLLKSKEHALKKQLIYILIK